MTGTIFFVLIILAVLGSGLMAGVFFAFSVFVMAALARLPAAQGITAMQAINVVVLSRVFLGVFFGTGLLGVIVSVAALLAVPQPRIVYLLIGTVVYIAGCIGVTIFCNVPRNNALAVLKAESAEGAAYWPRYVTEWTMWNHVRTAACILATAAFVVAGW